MTRFCVFCGELRDPLKGKAARGSRVNFASEDRCGEDAKTTPVRFDGETGERLDPPPMPRRSLLASYLGGACDDVARPKQDHRRVNGRRTRRC